jgi:hypothetical protein
MRLFQAFITGLLLPLTMSLCGVAEHPRSEIAKRSDGDDWVRLFDGASLDGWYTSLQKRGRNDDPTQVFQLHDGTIHVYKDQPDGGHVDFGYLATDSAYARYHLRLEYRWGTKKFPPRGEQRRDAGLLYHVVGQDTVWPRCIECQIQENDVGDCFVVRGTQVATSVEIVDVETPSGLKKLPRYLPAARGGVLKTVGEGPIARIVKSRTYERDGWNTVEVMVYGSEGIVHVVNGHTVFEATDLRQLNTEDKSWQPLAEGRIALQAEYAEVLYRNVEIRPIPDEPRHPAAGR